MRQSHRSNPLAVGKILPILLLAACSTAPKNAGYARLPIELPAPNTAAKKWCAGWARGMDANISYVTLSADASRILVSTSSDRGKPKGMEGRLRLFDSRGVMKWSKWVKQPAKAQSLAADASRVAFSNYEDKLYVLDLRGRSLWEKEHLGAPYIFKELNRLVLVNDDDSDPQTAFVAYNLSGKKLGEARVEKLKEPVDVAVAPNGSHVAVAMRGGAWEARTLDGVLVSKGTIEGDPAAIAIDGSRVAILLSNRASPGSQRLSVFDAATGARAWTAAIEDRRHEHVRIAGRTVFLYGNSTRGQSVVGFDLDRGERKWSRSIAEPAIYSSPVVALSRPAPHIALILDKSSSDPSVEAGTLHVTGIGEDGAAVYEIAVEAEDGIYSFAIDPNATFLVAGTGKPGDGILRSYSPCKD